MPRPPGRRRSRGRSACRARRRRTRRTSRAPRGARRDWRRRYVRFRKSVRSSIGARWRRSRTTNEPRETAAIAKAPTIRAEPQPYVFASIRPYVRANRPTAEVASPGRSSRSWVGSRDSSIRRKLATIPTIPTGTLTKKIQCQLAWSVRRPPTSGPMASARAETPAQMPIAVPRSRGGKVAAMIDSVAGFIRAAPAPCATRAAMSMSPVVARPQARDAAVKTTIPTTNRAAGRTRRRACRRSA